MGTDAGLVRERDGNASTGRHEVPKAPRSSKGSVFVASLGAAA